MTQRRNHVAAESRIAKPSGKPESAKNERAIPTQPNKIKGKIPGKPEEQAGRFHEAELCDNSVAQEQVRARPAVA